MPKRGIWHSKGGKGAGTALAAVYEVRYAFFSQCDAFHSL
jgi:hypothetical protein